MCCGFRAPEKQRYSSPLRLAKTSKLDDIEVSGVSWYANLMYGIEVNKPNSLYYNSVKYSSYTGKFIPRGSSVKF